MKILLIALLAIASSSFGKETITYETLLSANLSKWDCIVLRRYLDDEGKCTGYAWERITEHRDRRIPGILEDNHCVLAGQVRDHNSNIKKVVETPDSFFLSMDFEGMLNFESALDIDAKTSGGKTTVTFSGNGPLYEEFKEYIAGCEKEASKEGELVDSHLVWHYKDEP